MQSYAFFKAFAVQNVTFRANNILIESSTIFSFALSQYFEALQSEQNDKLFFLDKYCTVIYSIFFTYIYNIVKISSKSQFIEVMKYRFFSALGELSLFYY